MPAVPPQLTFMALLTLAMLLCQQGASIYMLVSGSISAADYLALWSPIVTLAMGYWFGRQGGVER